MNYTRFSFLWSEVRLLIAALALFLGGVPPVLKFNPIDGMYGTITALLKLCWLISGVASAYLLYRWYNNNQMVFGGKNQKDTIAFFISVISGINLGLVVLLQQNIGMTIASGRPIFFVVGILYVVTAFYLNRRWKEYGERLF